MPLAFPLRKGRKPCGRACRQPDATMKLLRAVAVPLLVLMVLATSAAGAPLENAAFARVNAALVENHVLPRYARLAAATDAFATASRGFCAGPGEAATRDRVQARFQDAMAAWMGVEHLRFGPIETLMRGHRFYFWPQARGKVTAAVRRLSAAGDEAAVRPSRISQANVAIQGLLAAEVLLHGDETLRAGGGAGAMGCALLEAIAGNMRTMAADLLADWQDGSAPFTRTVAKPGPKNEYFQDHKEATRAFFKSLHDSLQLIADVKLKPVIGDSPEKVRPRLAESRLSGRSLGNVIDNLAALRALYEGENGPGLGDLARTADPKLHKLLRKAFRITLGTARGIGRPLEEAAADAALRPKAEKLALQVRALKQIVRDRLAPALGFPVGFNALDGD